MSTKAWWYIFRVSERGGRVEQVAGPFKYFRLAHGQLTAYPVPPAGSQLVIDSVHYDPARLGGRGIGAQEQNVPAPCPETVFGDPCRHPLNHAGNHES